MIYSLLHASGAGIALFIGIIVGILACKLAITNSHREDMKYLREQNARTEQRLMLTARYTGRIARILESRYLGGGLCDIAPGRIDFLNRRRIELAREFQYHPDERHPTDRKVLLELALVEQEIDDLLALPKPT